MTDNDESNIPAAFQSTGFPNSTSPEEPSIEQKDEYPYQVIEPEPVIHSFEKPEKPESPTAPSREWLEAAVPIYVKWVLKEYNLNVEYERLTLEVDGRFTKSLGTCGCKEYHKPYIRISSNHYVNRGYSWKRCKETIRHELAHAWQVRWLGYSSHGPTFREKAHELDVNRVDSRYGDEDEPTYIGHCQNCGSYFTRQRLCKVVRNPYSNCSTCDTFPNDIGREDSVWEVFRNTDWQKIL